MISQLFDIIVEAAICQMSKKARVLKKLGETDKSNPSELKSCCTSPSSHCSSSSTTVLNSNNPLIN
ncbi:hypothetical protein SOVF_048820 [Spinacia oleracea]|nr:hypothetical protein SOVF_048820 [Spinacia oleracea]